MKSYQKVAGEYMNRFAFVWDALVVQGVLVMKGLLDVEEERNFTRKIFNGE